MTLSLYDTMARAERAFEPSDPNRITLYLCGPTVWNYAHIGNARGPVVFDVLRRRLNALYGEDAVVFARNVTDIDDKIIAKAAEEGAPESEITERFERIYLEDMAALGVVEPDVAPRATQSLPEMIALIERLIANGAAYQADGHVLFRVAAFDEYGGLSGRAVEDMRAGARVEVADYKADPADFVLWKPSKPGEPAWDSPFGAGRPGWHLECSAMIAKHLGETIDIHAGGADLVFPHHENEIAQSTCANGGAPLARYWLHNGFLTMDAEKMSKSLGNVALVHDLLKTHRGETLRFALLSAHYRQPLDWTDALLAQSKATLDGWYQALRRVKDVEVEPSPAPDAVTAALDADLNTPAAFAAVSAAATALNKADGEAVSGAKQALLGAGAALGLLQADPDAWFQGAATGGDLDAAAIDDLLAKRQAARKAKDFAEADRIRDELTAKGVEIQDGPQGATWRRAG